MKVVVAPPSMILTLSTMAYGNPPRRIMLTADVCSLKSSIPVPLAGGGGVTPDVNSET
jgi:hypothetical protein